jgi:hypothetical protein
MQEIRCVGSIDEMEPRRSRTLSPVYNDRIWKKYVYHLIIFTFVDIETLSTASDRLYSGLLTGTVFV